VASVLYFLQAMHRHFFGVDVTPTIWPDRFAVLSRNWLLLAGSPLQYKLMNSKPPQACGRIRVGCDGGLENHRRLAGRCPLKPVSVA